MYHLPGPYKAVFHLERWLVVSGSDVPMATCVTQVDAERIAYCLTIVEESEETAKKDGQ